MKTILLTGAGSGIGMDSAFALAVRGHKVIATTETQEQAELVVEEAKARGVTIEAFKLDITQENDRLKILSYDLDVLINNAGIGETGPLAEVPMDRIRKVFEVNVFSTLALSQLALKGMLKKGRGTVIVVSSVAGRAPMPFLNPYSMTKFALSGGIAAMRSEVHQIFKGVHISLVEPGAYATGFNQRMMATKYEWLDEHSAFYKLLPELRKNDENFKKIEAKSTASIVRKIVQASESSHPRLRYVAPTIEGIGIALLRIFGV